MKRSKGWLLLALIGFGALFFAFRNSSIGRSTSSNPRQQLLTELGKVLEDLHYTPKVIDDQFSKMMFSRYLDQMDGDKTLFLQKDIDSLKIFETSLDNEIHGSAIAFVPAVSSLYDRRMAEATIIYKELLKNPFSFSSNETAELDGEKLAWAKNEEERKDRWRKKLSYFILERFYDLQEQREKNKDQKDFVVLADSALERKAREQVLKVMNDNFARIKSTFNEEVRFSTYLNTITNLMDPHSDYFAPVEKRAFDERMSSEFFGIGAQLTKDDYGIKIASIITGGAAYKSGQIVVNDIIIKVAQGSGEPVDVSAYATEDAVKLIRGNKGTEVRLTLKKEDGTIKVVALIREKVELDQGLARSAVILQGTKKIGYILLPDFYSNFEDANGHHCAEDVAEELKKLKAEKVDGIVMDIRNNGGGSLYEVVKMVGLFIKSGPIVQVKDRSGNVDQMTWRDNDESILYDGPIAVLVNEFSASASEIFAGAIQDYNRGIIIGSSSTFGKGTVQRQIPFGSRNDFSTSRTDMGAMTLTFQKFYRVNGGSTQLKGIVPDIIIPDKYEYYKVREKDMPEALAWDEIQKATFLEWQPKEIIANIAAKENAQIQANANLNLLKNNLIWLSKNVEQPIPLQLDTYRQKQKQMQTTDSQNSTLLISPTEMEINYLAIEKDKFLNQPDKSKADFYAYWIKSLRKDMHIEEGVRVVEQLAAAQKTGFVKK
ncbi:MAG: carboxy terminal-processing peptidase [Bacteroidetes bacterium]|nr:carboxy terminal-processing peptidase [Bacteroidota bacterium]